MNNILYFLSSMFLCSQVMAVAESPLIPMGGAIPRERKVNMRKMEQASDPLIMGSGESELVGGESNASFVQGAIKETNMSPSQSDKLRSKGSYPLGAVSDNGYVSYQNHKLVQNMDSAGKSSFTFSIIKDEFDYISSSNANFSSTYRRSDAEKSDPSYMLLLQGERFLYRSYIEFSWGVNAGIGYNGGYGIFSNGLQSTAFLRMWTLPVDGVISMKLPITSWIKISLSGGPSAIAILQYRNDLEDGHRDKRMRTGSFGYFAGGKFQISLSSMSSSMAHEFFRDYEITKVYLNLEARMHDYSSFKDSGLSVSGSSFGAGFTFEYL